MKTYVAVDDGQVPGTDFIKPNQPGLGTPIANGGYRGAPQAQGQGIGSLLCEHSRVKAKKPGYKAW